MNAVEKDVGARKDQHRVGTKWCGCDPLEPGRIVMEEPAAAHSLFERTINGSPEMVEPFALGHVKHARHHFLVTIGVRAQIVARLMPVDDQSRAQTLREVGPVECRSELLPVVVFKAFEEKPGEFRGAEISA